MFIWKQLLIEVEDLDLLLEVVAIEELLSSCYQESRSF